MLHAGGYTAALGAQLALLYCAVRAGQSRSWREKLDTGADAGCPGAAEGSGLPHAQGEPGPTILSAGLTVSVPKAAAATAWPPPTL